MKTNTIPLPEHSIENNSSILLKTFLYFALFKFPLTEEEALKFCPYKSSAIRDELHFLISKKLLFKLENFFLPVDDISWILKRKKENKTAKKMLIRATKMSRFISQFPFVEAVFLSGSISKGIFKKDDDIDYFIITSNNRLWLSRTLLILFKKIFLLNSKKYFCVNYFISQNALEIEEKNRFTATEFITLIPMTGNGVHNQFEIHNGWVFDFFPNYVQNKEEAFCLKKGFLKRFFEFLLNGSIGDQLDGYFMKITKDHQKKKFTDHSKPNFDLAFKGNKKISKHHPKNYQIRVLNSLNNKIDVLNKKHKLSIPFEK